MLIKVNGRSRFFPNLEGFNRIRDGAFEVKRGICLWLIEGGKSLGGGSRDWFLSGPGYTKPIPCTSVMDALNLLSSM
jgi:hypothetical protein